MENKIINGDCLEELKTMEDNSVDSMVTDPPYGISFMGKKWDYDVPKIEVWKECLRVLKPGGHALIACGTRTQHRMAVNLEDSGFDIRDIVAWVYGSGFPKSHNIGKSVDKLLGNDREVISETFRGKNAGKQSGIMGKTVPRTDTLTKGSSPYEGWGTALKPAMELWTLCRKPLEEKTIAKNVLKYGTGGINIDGCRVETNGEQPKGSGNPVKNADPKAIQPGRSGGNGGNETSPLGRFPANLIHDGSEEVVSKFPNTKSGNLNAGHKRGDGTGNSFKGGGGVVTGNYGGESGSASRFFYCAKASKSERNKGLEGFEEKKNRPLGISSWKNLTNGSGNVMGPVAPQKNNHPTVKPVKLMQYLCRLITQKGGTILDPFMGSGSTGIGAKLEGFDFIGIEREREYYKIARARIQAWDKQTNN